MSDKDQIEIEFGCEDIDLRVEGNKDKNILAHPPSRVIFKKPRRRMHFADAKKSARLQRVLNILKDGQWHSTWDLAERTMSMAVHSDISELRLNKNSGGDKYKILCEYHGLNENHRKVYRYKLIA